MNYTPIDDLIQSAALEEIARILQKYNLVMNYNVAISFKAKK